MKALKLLATGTVILNFGSCGKEDTAKKDCFPDQATTRRITNAPASVLFANGSYYLVERGSIDLRLLPCTLEDAYKQNGLQVIISGDVKGDATGGGAPCCTSNLVITRISR